MVSLCGLLRRTVTATSAPKNSARRTMTSIRSHNGIAATSISLLGGPSAQESFPLRRQLNQCAINTRRHTRKMRSKRKLNIDLHQSPTSTLLGPYSWLQSSTYRKFRRNDSDGLSLAGFPLIPI